MFSVFTGCCTFYIDSFKEKNNLKLILTLLTYLVRILCKIVLFVGADGRLTHNVDSKIYFSICISASPVSHSHNTWCFLSCKCPVFFGGPAGRATGLTGAKSLSPFSNFYPSVDRCVQSKWQTLWDAVVDNKLPHVHPLITALIIS
jgi:hypothetical protein